MRYTSFLVAFILSLFVCFASARQSTAVSVLQPLIAEQSNLALAIDSAKSQRVDFIMIGDSNQLYGGHGFDHGYQCALSKNYLMYATGLVSLGENQGQGAGIGYRYGVLSNASAGVFGYPNSFLWKPYNAITLETGASMVAVGMAVGNDCPIHLIDGLRFHYRTGTSAGVNGNFTPGVHMANSPFSPIVRYNRVNTDTGHSGSRVLWNDFPPSYTGSVHFRMNSLGITGPFIGEWIRAENPTRTKGFSVHTWYGYGGQSARDMAAAFQEKNLQSLGDYLTDATALQQPTSPTIIRICTGLNDRNEATDSILNHYNPDSPEAYVENITYVLNRIHDAWVFVGKNPTQLFFVVTMSHKISSPNDPELIAYENVLPQIEANVPNTTTVKLSSLATQEEMNQWYTQPMDPLHLKQIGYETLSERELAFIMGW